MWASPDRGANWYLIAGRTAAGVAAGGGHDTTSFIPLSRPATGMDHNGRIWRVGGSSTDGTYTTAVWSDTPHMHAQSSTRPSTVRPEQGRLSPFGRDAAWVDRLMTDRCLSVLAAVRRW